MTANQSTPTATPPADDHDDLIVVPKTQSKLMYYSILGLMLFVLVIFTVGGPLTDALTSGGGAGGGGVYVTWVDPLNGEQHSINERSFMDRKQSLQILMEVGIWRPANPDATRATIEDEDVVLYEVLDQLAADAGIEVSDQEYINTLRGAGFTDEILRQFSRRFRMDGRMVQGIIKAGIRPSKMLGRLLSSGVAYCDPVVIEATWKENNPVYSFQFIELKREDYVDQARANALPEEELIAWLDEQPQGAQQRFQTEPKVRAEVAWLSPGEGFDATALLEEYPAAEGTDSEARGQFYFNTARSTRFRFPQPETEEEQDTSTDAPGDTEESTEAPTEAQDTDTEADTGVDTEADAPEIPAEDDADSTTDTASDTAKGTSTGQSPGTTEENTQGEESTETPAAEEASQAEAAVAQDPAPVTADDQAADDKSADVATKAADDQEATEPQKPIAPPKFYYDFDEVKDQAIAEAAIWDAMTAFLEDVRTRMQIDGTEVDWLAEAAALGLEMNSMDEALERSKIAEVEGWGGRNISNQLSFAQVDAFVPRVQVEEGGMVIARLLEKIDPERKPWAEIEEDVLTQWARSNAIEIAVDSLMGVLEACAERGTDEAGDPLPDREWTPEVDGAELSKSASLANFTLVNRAQRMRNEWPGDDPNKAAPVDRFLRGQPDLYELEEGQVGYPRKDFTGDRAYLVRLKAKNDPNPKKQMKAEDVLLLRQITQSENATELSAAFYPKSEWFVETFTLAWPTREAREEAEASKEAADPSESN